MPATVEEMSEPRSAIVVGAGIVGACLTHLLTQRGVKVTLVDQAAVQAESTGSTGLAPGFVATYHNLPVLQTLGKQSADYYEGIDNGFARVGGLEVAFTKDGEVELRKRMSSAQESGFEASWLEREEAIAMEPRLLDRGKHSIIGAVWYPEAGTANAKRIRQTELQQAERLGATFVHATVLSVDAGTVNTKERGTLRADDVVVCTGIWARELLPDVACYAVAHPYVYSTLHESGQERYSEGKSPFIRFLEYHVYARDHGARFGLGTYGHAPILLSKENDDERHLARTATATWQDVFLDTLKRDAQKTLPDSAIDAFALSERSTVKPETAFNGSFAVTPDCKPVVGAYKLDGRNTLHVCVAVWVTHAYGAAKLLADSLCGTLTSADENFLKELDPRRFEGTEERVLERNALATYNDIYSQTS